MQNKRKGEAELRQELHSLRERVAELEEKAVVRQRAEDELRQSLKKLRWAIDGTIHALAMTVETRDPYTAGHHRRVAELACAIAEKMRLPCDQIDGIRVASLTHDIGKVHVPVEILSKPAQLSDVEFAVVREHCRVGAEILGTVPFPWPVAQTVLQHHERLNGSGYPSGLRSEDIVFDARILAVADVTEAMVSPRAYHPALSVDSALEELTDNRGTLYDPCAVDACLSLLRAEEFAFAN